MKADGKRWMKAVLFIAAAALAFWGAYIFLDVALHYRIGSWFERTFFTDLGYAKWSNGGVTEVHDFRWTNFKDFLLIFGIGAAMLWAASLSAAACWGQRQTRRDTARDIGRLLRQYFTQEGTEAVFPAGYQEVADYAAILKEQQRQSQQLLLAESQRKNDLIAYLAHDLKTPLTSVIGYLSLLTEAPDMPPEQKAKFTGIALEKALRLESLINEFFDITRYNTNQIVLEKGHFDLRYMLEQLADEFYPILQQQGKTVHIDAGEDMIILADPAKLARVCNNILKNAVAYSHPGTAIAIRAEKRETSVCIAITNQGRTIPKQHLDVIFDKFYRLDDARSSNTGGAGLGLAIAREIVTAHGGTIRAESRDGVTTFTVELPV